ncbi:hypothetical protein RI129_001072 [Pyrocoelia pectoralis]|uniref:THAP-type domain-containing protein n=1 Tax=Pyrocoelia pectoralis TaxID=417401 RepID=A0AAN7VUI4_9COLE
MVCCLVVGCGSTSVRDNNLRNVCYVLSQRRNRWIAAIKREDLTETKINCGRVCSKHFITGKPANWRDVDNPDWVPNKDMGHQSILQPCASEENVKPIKNSIVALK